MAKDKVKKSIFKRWWFWVVAVIVVIIVASAASGGGGGNKSATASAPPTNSGSSGSSSSSSSSSGSSSSSTKTYSVGQTATVDKFQVKVNSVKYVSKINDGGTGAVTQNGGVWMIANVTIKNNDTKARTIDSSLFTVLKGSVKYSASDTADMFINNNNDFFLSQVNPGLSATGNIAFNVPAKDAYQLQVNSGFLAQSSAVFNLGK